MRSILVRTAVVLLAFCAAAGASAQQISVTPPVTPVQPGFLFIVDVAESHDSNVTRKPSGGIQQTPPLTGEAALLNGPVGSWIEHEGFEVDYNQENGRQTVYFSAAVGHDNYNSASIYTSTTDLVRAGWTSLFTEGIQTDLHAQHGTALANQADFSTVVSDLITRDSAGGWVHVPISGTLNAVAAVEDVRTRHGLDANASTNSNALLGAAGLGVFPDPDHDASLLFRAGNTEYPEAGAAARGLSQTHDEYIDLNSRWQFSGFSTVSGRIGYQRHEYAVFTFRNASGPTFDLSYVYTPLAKLSFRLDAGREFGSPGDNVYVSATTNRFRLGATWTFSDKIEFIAHVDELRANYDSNLELIAAGLSPAQTRNDSGQIIGVSASWKPTQELTLESEIRHDERTSTLEIWNYSAQVFLVRAKVTW